MHSKIKENQETVSYPLTSNNSYCLFFFFLFLFIYFILFFNFFNFKIFNSYMRSQTWTLLFNLIIFHQGELYPLLKNCSVTVTFHSLLPHGLQHARPPCLSLSPRVWLNSCPLHQWCYLTISSSAALFSFCLQSPVISVFSTDSAFHIEWTKCWSFSSLEDYLENPEWHQSQKQLHHQRLKLGLLHPKSPIWDLVLHMMI